MSLAKHLTSAAAGSAITAAAFTTAWWGGTLTGAVGLRFMPDLQPGEKCRVRLVRVDENFESCSSTCLQGN